MVCWQKNEKLRRSWDDSKELELVLKGKLRGNEVVVQDFGVWDMAGSRAFNRWTWRSTSHMYAL